jgi:pantothenate kinase-related protein Tda10
LKPFRPSAPLSSSLPGPFIIGICGQSGGGKSALARNISKTLASTRPSATTACLVLSIDSFFNHTLNREEFGHFENPEGIKIRDFMCAACCLYRPARVHRSHATPTPVVI